VNVRKGRFLLACRKTKASNGFKVLITGADEQADLELNGGGSLDRPSGNVINGDARQNVKTKHMDGPIAQNRTGDWLA